MDFSCFNLLGAICDLDIAFTRLHDIYKSIDSCELDSFYEDLCSLRSFVDSVCDKYYKNS